MKNNINEKPFDMNIIYDMMENVKPSKKSTKKVVKTNKKVKKNPNEKEFDMNIIFDMMK